MCVCVDCICFIVIVRVCARFAASSCQCEIFEKYPSLLVPPPVAAVRDFEFRAFGFRISFFFLRPAAARSIAVKFSVVRGFSVFGSFSLFEILFCLFVDRMPSVARVIRAR